MNVKKITAVFTKMIFVIDKSGVVGVTFTCKAKGSLRKLKDPFTIFNIYLGNGVFGIISKALFSFLALIFGWATASFVYDTGDAASILGKLILITSFV